MTDVRYDVIGIGSAPVGGRPTKQESMATTQTEERAHV